MKAILQYKPFEGSAFFDLGEMDLAYPTAPSVTFAAYHYCCPSCGIEWGRMYPLGKAAHQFLHLKCNSCGGGSFRLWGDFPLRSLPVQALVREIELIISKGEKYDYLNHSGR